MTDVYVISGGGGKDQKNVPNKRGRKGYTEHSGDIRHESEITSKKVSVCKSQWRSLSNSVQQERERPRYQEKNHNIIHYGVGEETGKRAKKKKDAIQQENK